MEKVPNIVIEPRGPNAKKIIEMDNEVPDLAQGLGPSWWRKVPPGR